MGSPDGWTPETPVIIAANRLPVRLSRTSDGQWRVEWAGDRMIESQNTLSHYEISERATIKFVGRVVDVDVPFEERQQVEILLREINCFPVFLEPQEAKLYYEDYCKQTLWPTFHNVVDVYSPVDVVLDVQAQQHLAPSAQFWNPNWQKVAWQAYANVNQLFAHKICELYEQGDVVWVQDYHLLLTPSYIVRKLRAANVGLFLHVPFPSSEVFRTLSMRKELLRGMLNADHIGFHLFEYARHFMSACRRILGLSYEPILRGQLGIDYGGRRVAVTCSHMAIDVQRIEETLVSADVRDMVVNLRQKYRDKKIFAGCDTIERLKGIPSKMLAFDGFLSRCPDFIGKAVLVQKGIHRRGRVTDYVQSKKEIEQAVQTINNKYRDVAKGNVVDYEEVDEFPYKKRVALWRVADVQITTVLRDGLNTTPFEYIATHKYDDRLDQVIDALRDAVYMPTNEREHRRNCDFQFVAANPPRRWAKCVLTDIVNARKKEEAFVYMGTGFGLDFRLMEVSAQFRGWPLNIIQGKDYIEVRPEGVGKGKLIGHLLNKMRVDGNPANFVLCIGDDVADELMFEQLKTMVAHEELPKDKVFTCTVGQKPSKAEFFVDDYTDVIALLKSLKVVATKSFVRDTRPFLSSSSHGTGGVSRSATSDTVIRKSSSRHALYNHLSRKSSRRSRSPSPRSPSRSSRRRRHRRSYSRSRSPSRSRRARRGGSRSRSPRRSRGRDRDRDRRRRRRSYSRSRSPSYSRRRRRDRSSSRDRPRRDTKEPAEPQPATDTAAPSASTTAPAAPAAGVNPTITQLMAQYPTMSLQDIIAKMQASNVTMAAAVAQKPARELYVGNLPPNVTGPQLQEFLSTIIQQVGLTTQPGNPIINTWTSTDGHFAFCEMRSVEECNLALLLNQLSLLGQPLKFGRPRSFMGPPQPMPQVSARTQTALTNLGCTPNPAWFAQPTVPSTETTTESTLAEATLSAIAAAQPATAEAGSGHRLIMSNIPVVLTEDQVKELVEPFGKLKSFTLVKDTATGASLGSALFEYEDKDVADQAVEGLNGLSIGGILLSVQRQPPNAAALPSAAVTPEDQPSAVLKMDGEEVPGLGCIYVRFGKEEDAVSALKALNGRKFGGNIVKVTYFPLDKFEKNELF
ncbi:hypothetical protein AM588_10008893 [Phytophthora nicotianae]|uniref:RRM domain-containing protein n=1 Tax=Phytophthora nicotianae TaxID=4792 RepID=A0A0W8DCR4_PHYNI|nr:hypothetical protein AM588_10008893 [Phytophthora nicotianae]